MSLLNPARFSYRNVLSWREVFGIWRANEAHESHWIHHYRERGFPSWDAWREDYAAPLSCSSRMWEVYRIRNPILTVPRLLGGPIRSWRRHYYNGRDRVTFGELANHPGIQAHTGLPKLLRAFPEATMVTGLLTDHGITIIEGMHRCTAIALAAQRRQKLRCLLTIAVADARGESLPLIGMKLSPDEP